MEEDIHDPAFVAALFDRCSARYRTWSAVASFGFISIWRRQCIARLKGQAMVARISHGEIAHPAPPMPIVVDLMAGTGEVWPNLLARFPKARIRAIDISERMHHDALERLHETRAAHISHEQADVLETDLAADSADMVISTFGLKTLSPDQQERLAQQVAKILVPGGCFSMIEASDPISWRLRPLYRFYMDGILPLIERLFLKGAQDFTMIGEYTRRFKNCSHFERALAAQGLVVSQEVHFFGCATSVAGRKPIAPNTDAD